jgi:hypothetical protein
MMPCRPDIRHAHPRIRPDSVARGAHEGGGVTPTIPLLERLAGALEVDLVIDFAPRAAA